MSTYQITTLFCEAEPKAVSGVYAQMLQDGFQIQQTVAVPEHGSVTRIMFVGIRETAQQVSEAKESENVR